MREKLHQVAHLLANLKQRDDEDWNLVSQLLTEIILEEEDAEAKNDN